MSKKRKMMIGIVIIAVGILVGITLITALNHPGPNAGLPYRSIAVCTDGTGNIYVARTDIHGCSYYTKIDTQGNILVNKKFADTDIAINYAIAVDSNKNVHILYEQGVQPVIAYTKIDNNGSVQIQKKLIGSGYCPNIVIDSNDCLHIVWCDGVTPGRYKRLDSNGNTLVEQNITDVYTRLHIGVDTNNYIHITGKYHMGPTYETEAYYIYHAVLDSNSTILDTKVFMSNASATDEYHMIEDNNGRLVYLGDRGTVDSDNNIHLIWLDNGTWYKKLDKNGTVLIDNKKVASKRWSAGPIMISDTSDNMYILGLYEREGVGFIKIDKNGNILLDKTIEV